MSRPEKRLYEFGPFRLDPAERLLLRDGQPVRLTPKCFDMLVALVENGGHLVEKDELLHKVWHGQFVEEGNLTFNISTLRRVLSEGEPEQHYIETVPKRGYRFVADVGEVSEGQTDPPSESPVAPPAEGKEDRELSTGKRGAEGGQSLPVKRREFGRVVKLMIAALVVLGIAAATWVFYSRRASALTEKDTVLLTDFDNKTGDEVFDGTLKQALAFQLEQSPFLNIFPHERVRETLRFMGRSPDERVTYDIAREICERHGIKAAITGTISPLGSRYLIGLEAISALTGDVIAREQTEAESKEQVIKVLGRAAVKLREKLGEALTSIQRFDVPLEQATTKSLEALKAYSLGSGQVVKGNYLESIPFLKRAVELDPNFARAHAVLSVSYYNTMQRELAAEHSRKAFELRERISEPERFYITSRYYSDATGETEKAIEVYEQWKQTYPNALTPYMNVSARYLEIGQFEKAADSVRELLRRGTGGRPLSLPYENMGIALLRLNRFDEARKVLEEAVEKKIESRPTHSWLYQIAFVQKDQPAMQQQFDWLAGNSDEHVAFRLQADTAFFAGRLRKARELYGRAHASAQRPHLKETQANYMSEITRIDALLGNCREAKKSAANAVSISPSIFALRKSAVALATCGEIGQAQSLIDEMAKQHPTDTMVNKVWLPVMRASIEIRQKNYQQALQLLRVAEPYEAAAFFWPNYLRGEAYLRQGAGAEAAAEFQKIIDHRGRDPLSWLYPLAYLGVARAAVSAGNMARARTAYEDFFALWKDADPDIRLLQQARREYEVLKMRTSKPPTGVSYDAASPGAPFHLSIAGKLSAFGGWLRLPLVLFALLLVGVSWSTAAAQTEPPRAYVADPCLDRVTVIDTATNQVIAAIPVGSNPVGVAITPDGTLAYVTNTGSDAVSVIDTATNTVISTIPVGNRPRSVAITPDGTLAYVTSVNSGTVSVIDTATNTVIDTVTMGPCSAGIAITPSPSPTHRSQCMYGGWRNFTNPTFRNQGECVSYVESQRPPR